MPQLDFYSYTSQLLVIILLSSILYIFLVKTLLPAIAITLKIRDTIIDKKVASVAAIEEVLAKQDMQVVKGVENGIYIFPAILNSVKEENIIREINILYLEGTDMENFVEDLEEELLLQQLRKQEKSVIENS